MGEGGGWYLDIPAPTLDGSSIPKGSKVEWGGVASICCFNVHWQIQMQTQS